MAKMSKSERKALKKQNQNNDKNNENKDVEIIDRDLGYDADFYVDGNGNEIECVRVDFVIKPRWYLDIRADKRMLYHMTTIEYTDTDGNTYEEKDIASCIAKYPDGKIRLVPDSETKSWQKVATSSSKPSAVRRA